MGRYVSLKKSLATTCIALLHVFVITACYGYEFKVLNVRNGLSHNRTFSITNDKQGLMWFSTKSGIDRYDGTSFRHYSLPTDKVSPGVSRSNFVIRTPTGDIWAYDNNGNIFRYVDRIGAFVLEITLSKKLTNNNIILRGISFGNAGEMLIYGSFGIVVYNYNSTKKISEILPFQKDKTPDICIVKHIAANNYSIGTSNGAFLMSISAHRYILKAIPFETSESRWVQAMALDPEQKKVYFGTFGGAVFVCDWKTWATKKLTKASSSFPIRNLVVSRDELYIGTDGYGLLKWNIKTEVIVEHYISNIENGDKIPSNTIYDIYLNGDNRIWLATFNRGIAIMDQNLPDFRFVYNSKLNNSVYGSSISCILQVDQSQMWFSTGNGISIYSAGKWHDILNSDPKIRYRILAMCEDKRGNIWVGGFNSGAICIDKKTYQIKDRLADITALNGKIDSKNIFAIYCDEQGVMWFGGLSDKVISYNPESKLCREYDAQAVNTITTFKNKLLIGTERGLFYLDRNRGVFVHWSNGVAKNNPVFNNHVNQIYPFKDKLWFGTEQGLVCYDQKNDSTKIYTRADGLASNVVYAISSDGLGRIWASTDRGLSAIDEKDGKIYSFDYTNGLKEDNFSSRAIALTADKKLWFGTISGAMYFEPEKIREKSIRAKLYFNDLLINYQSVYDTTASYQLIEGLNELHKITLNHNQNSFSFDFSAINYSHKSRIYYRWKLLGYDKNFIDSRTGVKPSYANMPAGTYEFVAQAIETVSGNLLDTRTIVMKIKSPWWATWYAKLIYAITLISLAYYIYKTIQYRKEQRDYDHKIRYFSDTAHEIKAPITLILGSLQKLSEETPTEDFSKSFLAMAIKHTKKLNLMVNRLLDFQRAEMRAMKLEAANYDIVDFIQSQIDKFYPLAIHKRIDLSLENKLTDRYLWFDTNAMEVIIDNLITNALKYTPENGAVKISLAPHHNREIIISVEDNGIGISKESQKQLFQRFYRGENAIRSGESGAGIGLLLARTLTELHVGKLEIFSEIDKGSKFSLLFKYGNAHLKDKKNITIIDNFKSKDFEETQTLTLHTHSDDEGVNKESAKPLILLVEDSIDLRLFIRRSLEDNYKIEEAKHANEAMEMLTKISPDLIISDVVMQGMDGYEFCRTIKDDINTSHIPLIMLTALDQKSNIVKGYDAGADNYITKPFDITLLKMKIENIINNRKRLKERLIQSIGGDQLVSMQNNADDLFLKRITVKLEANIADSEYSIDQLCADMKISRSTFYNKIKGLTNHSPNDFVRIFRLNKAAQLLKSGDHNVNEVADMTGFADVKYFSTIFKKHFNVSPSKFL